MFQLNQFQKNDLWMAFARNAEAGFSFIQGDLHIKLGNHWQNTRHWDVQDAESAFGRKAISLSTHETPLGAIGRCKDFSEALNVISTLLNEYPSAQPAVFTHALKESGFVMTGTGDMVSILSAKFLGSSAVSRLSAMDRPGLYTLIHPKNHPRLRCGSDPKKDPNLFVLSDGFMKVQSPSLFIDAMLTMMEQEPRRFEVFQHQLHTFMVNNNLSVQSSLNSPVPDDAEVWQASATPCVRTAFEHFSAGNHVKAEQTLLQGIQLIYRPIKIREEQRPRPRLVLGSASALARDDLKPASTEESSLRKEAMLHVLATAPVDTLTQKIMHSRSFNAEERAYFLHMKEKVFSQTQMPDLNAQYQLTAHFLANIEPWLQQKAEHDFPLFRGFFANVFAEIACPDWYKMQLEQLDPKLNASAIAQGAWWDAVRRLKKLCSPEVLTLLQEPYDDKKHQVVLKQLFDKSDLVSEWLDASGFRTCFSSPAAAQEPETMTRPAPLPIMLF